MRAEPTIETICQYAGEIMNAATPWLVGMAVGFLLLWLVLLMRERKPFTKGLTWFDALAPLHKFIVVCAVSFFTLWGGSKERGPLPSGPTGGISSALSRVVESIQLRTLPESVSSNAFAVTDFAVDSRGKETAFEVVWATNHFESVDSRNVDLFMSTNLSARGWLPIGCCLMPPDTNSYAFAVTSNDVAAAYRSTYVDSFSRMAFFRFGLDFDSDGDGLTDSYENLVSFTDPSNPDTDRDGLSDAQELAAGIGANPLLYDTDGDGVGDGDEVAAGSDPHSSDTDGDGISDGAEVGTYGSDPRSDDTDADGLSDALEVTLGTALNNPDSDGDGMNDGWEYLYRSAGFDPAVDNATDGNPDNDIGADLDGDGLANGQECEWGTNPSGLDEKHDGVPDGRDTDGDGVNDGTEIGQNGDPTDPSDEGKPNTRIPVPFYFGDPSGSHSEKYRLEVTPVSGTGETPASFSWINANYGERETKIAMLKLGWKYEVRLLWTACNHPHDGSYYPNYDYTLNLGQNVPTYVVLDDPDSLFRSNYYGGEYYGASHFPVLDAVATITVFAITDVSICKPDDSSWTELEASRVVLDDEELRIKIEISPQVKSLAQCRQAFGDTLTVKTSGTCPTGASMSIGDDATLVNSSGKSEIRISKTRQQLISLGLLPSQNDDGVNEMAWVDVPEKDGQDLTDSTSFSALLLRQ